MRRMFDVVAHPGFGDNKWIYFSYSKPGEGRTPMVLARGRYDGAALTNVQDLYASDPLPEFYKVVDTLLAWAPEIFAFHKAGRFSNGRMEAVYEGRNIDGQFVTVLRAEGREWIGADFMRTSVERFIDAVRHRDPARALVTGEAGLRQLEVLVGVWDRCWRGRP